MKAFTRYLDQIARVNGLALENTGTEASSDEAKITWLFYPGMLQDSRDKWWADFGLRHAMHEGIDICFYASNSRISALPPGTRVPAMFDGTLINVADDLLGQSMVVSYSSGFKPPGFQPSGAKEKNLVLVYSHLEVDKGLTPGTRIYRDQVIARTFDTRIKNSKLLSHIHLSCMIVPKGVPPLDMNWSLFPDRKQVEYINPVFL